jgi:hypothetical protein
VYGAGCGASGVVVSLCVVGAESSCAGSLALGGGALRAVGTGACLAGSASTASSSSTGLL